MALTSSGFEAYAIFGLRLKLRHPAPSASTLSPRSDFRFDMTHHILYYSAIVGSILYGIK